MGIVLILGLFDRMAQTERYGEHVVQKRQVNNRQGGARDNIRRAEGASSSNAQLGGAHAQRATQNPGVTQQNQRGTSNTQRRIRNSHTSHQNTRTPHQPKDKKPRKPTHLEQLVTDWVNRLLGVVNDRSFHEGSAQYAPNQTKSDFLWNTAGTGVWGVVFPLLTIVVTQISGATQAGMFSMSFVVATLLMILANFGIRTFQISDVCEAYSFADYRINRLITCVAAVVVGWLYCSFRGYDSAMVTMTMGVVVYKTIDGFADVYEGRLQQVGKMYLAGVSMLVRSVCVFVLFCIVLVVSQNLEAASIVMAVVAVLTLVFFTLPLAHMETPKSAPVSVAHVFGLFKQSWPLFAALFIYSLADNMPKFVMEGELSYDNQLYYNALYFPAMFILMTAQAVYKPMLVSMAKVWHDPQKRMRFDLIILAVVVFIVVLTALVALVMLWVGLDVLGFLYGLDFQPFRSISLIMLVAGGVTAGIDFLYQTVTILRRQKDIMVAYVIALVLSAFVPLLLIHYAQLEGAVIGYLVVMSVLFMLMLYVYFRIRFTKAGTAALAADAEEAAAAGGDAHGRGARGKEGAAGSRGARGADAEGAAGSRNSRGARGARRQTTRRNQ